MRSSRFRGSFVRALLALAAASCGGDSESTAFDVVHSLTIEFRGGPSGGVQIDPYAPVYGFDDQGRTVYKFTNNAVVTATALPDAMSKFVSWSGSCSGSSTCVVTMDANRDIIATFAPSGSVR